MGIKSPKFLRSRGSRRTNVHRERTFHNTNPKIFYSVATNPSKNMATFELYRRSTIGMCLTETLDEMVQNGTLSPELAIQVLVQFDKSMTEALETQVKSKVNIKGHLHTYRFCDNVWTFILQDALFKNEDSQENVGRVKIVACDSKLLTQ
ncbi:transcription initiation factor IIA subunit 2 [Prunus yedoensis var. nudiflora]|uniref:Transcription initiation factor IIA subunit 2 n=3 Tax=Magnoliopsida TaxID=3398 RepID=A0A314XU68_PRUYE|nr:transcription initiation factor IIA subunit 2 [Prunus yedoensis var. nudiflora]